MFPICHASAEVTCISSQVSPRWEYRNEIILDAGFPHYVVLDNDHLFLDALYILASSLSLDRLAAKYPDFDRKWLAELKRIKALPRCWATKDTGSSRHHTLRIHACRHAV